MGIPHPYWPLFDLRVRTPRVELRVPSTDGDLVALVALVKAGIHDPGTMPFETPWTDRPSPELERGVFQWSWRQWGTWAVDEWNLSLAVVERKTGEIVGVQDVGAKDFPQRRTVTTGSWLGKAHQGLGIGREMRAAVLHLAFAGLGSQRAESVAWHDNEASMRVSRSLGYRENGDAVGLRRGRPDRQVAFALDREDWARRDDIELGGLKPCLVLFGLEARVAGVDRGGGGWVVATVPAEGIGEAAIETAGSFSRLTASVEAGELEAVAVDIPIGLPTSDWRRCDRDAKQLLGKRSSSVYLIPPRDSLRAPSYADARAISAAAMGKKPSAQAHAIRLPILEVDELVTPELQEKLIEVHPEVVFVRLAGGPLEHPKRLPEGIDERVALLTPHVPNAASLAADPPEGTNADDVVDALAAAVTARALLRGEVERLGDDERDERGLRMEMVAPRLTADRP